MERNVRHFFVRDYGKKKETDLLTGIEITSLVAGISCGTHNAATPTVIEIEIGVDAVMTARGLI